MKTPKIDALSPLLLSDAALRNAVSSYVSETISRQPDGRSLIGITMAGITLTRMPFGNVDVQFTCPEGLTSLTAADLAEVAGFFEGAARFVRMHQIHDPEVVRWDGEEFPDGNLADR